MNSYIDFHSHILYGIDDGARTIEESISIIKKLVKIGFKEIVLTPHYRQPYFKNNKEKQKVLKELNKELKDLKIDVKLYLANEVAITTNIIKLIKDKQISLLNNYLFLELPFNSKIHNLEKIIYELQENNINIILVHPERYSYFTKEDYQKLIDLDILFQVNYESISGKYGNDAKKKVKYLYKNNLVEFISSDIHHENSNFYKIFSKVERKIIKIVGIEKYKDLTYNNMKKIID